MAVCIATYRRHGGLRRLLASLPAAIPCALPVRILVLDNASEPEVEALLDDFRSSLPGVQYVPVRLPGISAARNAALAMVTDTEMIAFIDDDEVAPPGWLAGLLTGLQRYGGDVVVGPVDATFAVEPPAWVLKSRCFDHDQPLGLSAGASLPWCATNNTLVTPRARGLAGAGFNEAYSLTGGGDNEYFFRAARAGARIVWLPGVVVTESVTASRASLRWVLGRAFRGGAIRLRIERDTLGDGRLRLRPWLLKRLAKGFAGIALGLGLTLLGCLAARTGVAVRGLQRMAAGIGTVSALGGRYPRVYLRANR